MSRIGDMRILCVSDEPDPLVYSPRIKERFGDVDLVLAAGDLPMEYVSYIVTLLNKPLIFVFGNHNLSELPFYRPSPDFRRREDRRDDRAWGGTYAGFKLREEAGVIVMGLDGSRRYNDGDNQFTQLEMWLRALALVPALLWKRVTRGRYLDVLLTHAPPEGVHDRPDPCHRGFAAFRWIMKNFRPRYLVHGHVHLYFPSETRTTECGGTTVVNAYSHCIIEREEPDV